METMNVLDSQLEALAFNYLSFGILTVIHNLWTWVAVITAAVSFWRIRAAGSLKSDTHGPFLDRNTVGSRPPSASPPSDSTEELAVASAPTSEEVTSFCPGEVNGVTKGKFTVYYEDEQESDGECTVAGNLDVANEVEVFDDWERMMRMRMGDLEWYRLQDLTVLNGNVVRLWEDSRRISSISTYTCVVWKFGC